LAYLFGLYPPFFAEMRYLLTEPFVLMLTTLFSLLAWKWFGNRKAGWFLGAAAVFAVIALTKVFFGYVALGVFIISLAAFKWSRAMRLTLPIYALALALCTPYLFYTYNLTGRPFCWANSGGSVLYWMYTPDANDFGSWFSDTDVANRPELAHHRAFFEQLKGLDYEQRDQLMQKKAIENIRSNPRKMMLNYVSNVSRLFLNFPFSYKYQHPRTLLYLVPNSLILGAIIFSLYPLIKLRRLLPEGILHACCIAIVFIGGQSLVYAEARYLCPILPLVFLVIVYTATNLIKVQKLEQ
jgi:4-amino-4-deoxy-L-arabinose transferase-like glycosyltransferase